MPQLPGQQHFVVVEDAYAEALSVSALLAQDPRDVRRARARDEQRRAKRITPGSAVQLDEVPEGSLLGPRMLELIADGQVRHMGERMPPSQKPKHRKRRKR